MSEIRKIAGLGVIHHKPFAQQGYRQKVTSHRKKCQLQTIWRQNRNDKVTTDSSITQLCRSVSLKKNDLARTIALRVLFPEKDLQEFHNIAEMPSTTLEEKVKKESAFRSLLLNHYYLKNVQTDQNCGLRAIVSCIQPEVDPKTEEITAFLLRGDVIEYVSTHPELLKESKDTPETYIEQMAAHSYPIGEVEIDAMSAILQSPIHIFSYEGIRIGKNHEITPIDQKIYGKEYSQPPICIYFDPIRSHYSAMYRILE